MAEQITTQELEKASRNVEKLSIFIGERRDWMLASDAAGAAASLADASRALAEIVCRLSGRDDSSDLEVRQPPKLEPSGRVTGGRLTKFADFIRQLRKWFAAHDGDDLPDGSDQAVTSLLAALEVTAIGVERLKSTVGNEQHGTSGGAGEPENDPLADPQEPLVSGDLGPVAEVDMSARLMLDDAMATPLLQVFQGVTELTPEAMSKVDAFFTENGVALEGPERRRLHDKILRWIQSTPEGQVLVVRLSGLSGKIEAYSSYRSRD
jgi:hypothetical protein